MICQNCHKKTASVYYTEIINGSVNKLYLCEDCARLGNKINKDIGLDDILASFMGFNHEKLKKSQGKLVCPKCNLTYDEFQKVGKLGCYKCYEVFGDKIESILKQLHGSVQYKGDVPNKSKDDDELIKLKEELNARVKAEEYEEAAKLRDRIREIENKKKD